MQAHIPVNVENMGHQEPQASVPQEVGNPMEEHQPNREINGGILKPKRNQNISIRGYAGEEAYYSLPKFTLQVNNGHPSTPGPNSGETSNDPSTQSKEESNFFPRKSSEWSQLISHPINESS